MEIDISIKRFCRTCLQSDKLQSLFDQVCLFDSLQPLADVLNRAVPELQPIVNKNDSSSNFICESCSELVIATAKFQKMAIESEKTIRVLLEKELFGHTIKAEVAGEISQDALSLMGKIETTLDASFPDCNVSNDFESESQEISGTESETEDDNDSKTNEHHCNSCSRSFSSSSRLSQHVNSAHLRDKNKCSEESDDFTSDNDAESAKIFHCGLCRKTFKKSSLLSRHMKSHDNNKHRMTHECHQCQKRFPSSIALLRHDIVHSDLVERSKIARTQGPQKFSCVVCGQSFETPESMQNHLKSHRGKSTGNEMCKLCLDVFPSRTDIIRHSKNHIENATHQCCLCNKLLIMGDELIDHFLRHKGMKPHKCPHCEKSFLKLHKLNCHLRTHSEDKLNSFLCPECGKSLSTNENLKRHLIRHSGIKPYACSLCPSRFVFKSGLTSHMSTHSGLKPFVCAICGSAFTKSSSLTKHHRIHTGERPFVCEICGLRFNSSDHVKRHFRTHTGERPYKCTHCDRSYAQSNDLLKHTRSHVGENTYKCNLCSAAFRLQAQRREHYAMEHYAAHIRSKQNSTEFPQVTNMDESMAYDQVKHEQLDDLLEAPKTFYDSHEKNKHPKV